MDTGLIITICNYDYYQNPDHYETNNETPVTSDNDGGITKPPTKERRKGITNPTGDILETQEGDTTSGNPDNYETNNENDNDTTTSQRSADTIDKKGRIEEGKKEEQDPPPAAPPAPYRQFTDAFCQLWANKHGAEYHWLKGDGPQAAEIWEVVHHDLAEGKRITKAYLADSDKYLQGHTIRKLAGEINRYLGTKSNVDPVEAAYPRRNPTPEEIALAYGQEADNGHA